MSLNLNIFEANKQDGIMSRNKKFFSENISQEEINKIFLKTRQKLGEKYGFDGKRVVQAKQKNEQNKIIYPNGKYINLDKIIFTKEDYWYEELPADILVFTKNCQNIVVGHQMADCPIIVAEDRKNQAVAVAHCGASYINRELPKAIINALIKEFKSSQQDIYVYIGSCASKYSYIYDIYPSWATNKNVWEKFIKEENGKYYIDLIGAIKKQLQVTGINHITASPIDTITNKNYASHYGLSHGNITKSGQNFVGCFYK